MGAAARQGALHHMGRPISQLVDLPIINPGAGHANDDVDEEGLTQAFQHGRGEAAVTVTVPIQYQRRCRP